jgi:DNA helicase-2/ATP-dependent DNA helicase PcrA
VVNVPPRGIGARTVDAVRTHARERRESMWRAAAHLIASGALATRAARSLGGFQELIDVLARDVSGLSLEEMTEQSIAASGLVEFYKRDNVERAQARIENLEELVTAARQFDVEDDGADFDPLMEFLSHAALEAGEQQAAEWEDCVQLMTLHSAKGLEFPMVFLCGLEEGLFPHQRSSDDADKLEEERRLCYVGMTRAKKRLVLTHAESRRLHGQDYFPAPSRFLREIPSEFIDEVRARSAVSRPLYRRGGGYDGGVAEGAPDGIALGQRVAHPKFGEGVVLSYEGAGSHARVQVNFERAGAKWLVLQFANLEPV